LRPRPRPRSEPDAAGGLMARPPLDGTVLVTGASSGIGAEFARQLAGEATALVLVARRRDRLLQLRDELVARHPRLRVAVYDRDLGQVDQVHELLATLARDGLTVDVLINDAGMGDLGLFETSSWDKLHEMLRINVVGFTALLLPLYAGMVARGRGGVLNVSSGFGLVFFPAYATYVGTKFYVTGLTESLRAEAGGTGVVVSQLCPGPVSTEFDARAGNRLGVPIPSFVAIPADQCVRDAIRGFRRGRATIVPGWLLWFWIHVGAATPRWVLRPLFGLLGRIARRQAARAAVDQERSGMLPPGAFPRS
ncbi:MAG: SDR family NAD(P)-dependent oxidoreductase, partial [Myxococcota bacterium]